MSDPRRHILWAAGEIDYLLDENQLSIDDAYRGTTGDFVLNCSRQIGKSFWLTTLVLGECFRTPGAQVKFATGTAKAAHAIIQPLVRQVLAECPPELRPRRAKSEGVWNWPSGSTLTIAGLDADDGDRLRGQRSHLFVMDEARNIENLWYVMNDIARPQTLTTGGRLVFASTPPASVEHPFVHLLREAESRGAYVHRTIHDCPRLDDATIERMAAAVGGVDSVTWRREFLAQLITDERRQIVPEWDDAMAAQCVREAEPAMHRDWYLAVDYGFHDATGILLAWWDFRRQKLVVERERLIRRMTTDLLAQAIRGVCKDVKPYLSVLDGPDILLADLGARGLGFIKPDKANRGAAVAALRELVGRGGLEVHPRCNQTVRQLHSGLWDEKREDFQRTQEPEGNGTSHSDLLAALVYMVRHVRSERNPYPATFGVQHIGDTRLRGHSQRQSPEGQAMLTALGLRRPRG